MNTWETEAGGSQIQGQPELHSKILSQNKQTFVLNVVLRVWGVLGQGLRWCFTLWH